jgi:acyl-CoA synthetase (AMP-forming)/AMP-acid ligase II
VYPGTIAGRHPDRPAVIVGEGGETVTFAELDARSNQLAHLLRERGLGPRGAIAIVMENQARFLEVAWAAQRAGLYYTAVNTHLTPAELGYLLRDCGATALVTSTRLAPAVAAAGDDALAALHTRLVVSSSHGADGRGCDSGSEDGVPAGFEAYEAALARFPEGAVADECEGDFVLYSSGTTGTPRGIQRPLRLEPIGQADDRAGRFLDALGMADGDSYLCPAPLYHAAPLAWSMAAQRRGAPVVVMERFDALTALLLIERQGVTHGQFVPTMFVRMLKLPPGTRHAFDLSSLRAAVHAAAPCPVEVKRQMIDWWGPIIYEYWASTEGAGATFIDSADWLAHPGSVGRPVGCEIAVRDEDGRDLPPRAVGTVWGRLTNGRRFEYRNDPDRTAEVHDDLGFATVGDIGYLDEEGYLYLTDRRAFTIISGGVNIYPQEAENVLVTHPRVLDVAVIGVPNPDLGEEVKAVVQPVSWEEAGPALEAELIAHCRDRIAHYKCPRSVDFEQALPRLDTGKLYKRVLRDRYWAGQRQVAAGD